MSEPLGARSAETDAAAYYFHQGTNTMAYRYLGVQSEATPDGWRYTFRVWAYRADAVEVAGDFNAWGGLPMQRITEQGIWEAVLDSAQSLVGSCYKFRVISAAGVRLKADPYARFGEWGEKTASIIPPEPGFVWQDGEWLRQRRAIADSPGGFYAAPLNIYELHLGSWMTRDGRPTAVGDAYLSYRELGEALAVYVRQMGYTHVELMPIGEHPYDGSWGYQCCGYFAPTSRFGSPDDLRYLINHLHENGIGVLLDWVPAHFPKDAHGLFEFDGYPMYEYQGRDRMEHAGWGTRCFDVGRNEVQSFLISCAMYWLREFHIDGLRTDAVAAMLYLDFDRKPGEWVPNRFGGRENLEAVAFFRKLNRTVLDEFPDVLMIAEESTAWEKVTHPVSAGGLGFSFKWNMGWANDAFAYLSTDPIYRRFKHDKLTFSLTYAFREHFILPVSHDEVVHGKRALLDKMFGDYGDKFSGMRTFLAYMMTHPGKKMLFMGCEYAPFREWDYANTLEWFMLDYPMHRKMQCYTAALNRFYLETPALWALDDSWAGFRWIAPDDAAQNVISFRRFDGAGGELAVLLNFAPVRRPAYSVRIDGGAAVYCPVFESDRTAFGGSGSRLPARLETVPEGDGVRLTLALPPLSAVFLAPWRPPTCGDAHPLP